MQRKNGNQVKLVRGIPKTIEDTIEISQFYPDEVWVTSLFTYWSKYVRDSVQFYKKQFPQSTVKVGGIYASLRPEDEVKKYTGADVVIKGVIEEAEKEFPAYDLLVSEDEEIDYQIVHLSRGCPRECKFCGTWIIEPNFVPKSTVDKLIKYKKIVFYDNNLLMNPSIEIILKELADLKSEKKITWCESQSGFDGRIFLEKPELAKMLRKAGFRYPRIAWDWGFAQKGSIEKQINMLLEAGYPSNQIYVFVLYNWDTTFEEMELKRVQCWNWKVQISDCRFRPLSQMYDHFDARKIGQTNLDYYIHESCGWTDKSVKQFRKNVRRTNICVREGLKYYSPSLEHKSIPKEQFKKLRNITFEEAKLILDDAWDPGVPMKTGDIQAK